MSENEDPSIQRGPTGSRADKKSTPSSRQSAQNEARELGIDPRGMSTREIKDVVKAEKDEQAEMRNDAGVIAVDCAFCSRTFALAI